MAKSVLFIDGENFLHKVKEVLKEESIDKNTIDLALIDLDKLFAEPLKGFAIARRIFYASRLHFHSETKKKDTIKKLLQRAEKCLVLGENKDAEMIARHVISMDSTNSEAYYFLGEALCKQGKFRESLDCLTQANKLLPNHPRIIHLLGWVIFLNGDGELGRKLMKKALEQIPDDVQILCDLAVLETGQENGEKAKEYVTRAYEIDPSNPLVQEVFRAVTSFDMARKKLGKNLN